jgi:hypothetical protein
MTDKDNGVSKTALKLAKQIDRLEPGQYTIDLAKTDKPSGIVYEVKVGNAAEAVKSN